MNDELGMTNDVLATHQPLFFGYRFRKVFLWLIASLFLITSVNAQTDDQQRYVGLQMINLDPRPEAGLDVIEAAVNNGCNLVAITIPWDEVYKDNTSAPDWRQYDRQIEYIAKTDAKIALRILIGRLNYRLEGFWTTKETMQDDLGRPLVGAYGRTCFSFSHQPTAAKARNFIKEVCQRYNSYQAQGKILYISFGNLSTQEIGFGHETQFEGGKPYRAGFDYSPPSVDEFRLWAQTHYKTINKLNYTWGAKFSSFQNLLPPRTAYTPLPAYQQRSGKDWYIFLHSQLKKFIEETISTIKAVNTGYKIINEYGSVTDDFSAMMGSYAFKDLDQKTDGTKVHNDAYYNHRWITDILRSNRPGKWVMNEVFYSPQNPADLLTRQFDECFEHGCKVVTLVASSPDPAAMRLLQNAANRWLKTPLTEIKPQLKMAYSLSEALDSTLKNAEKRWRDMVGANPQPVQVELSEDLLSEDYWKPLSVNIHPVVSNPVTERAGKPRKVFNYTLPKDVFTDPDGEIVSIEVTEKPQWITYNNGVFSGTIPDQLGDYKIALRATDDEGATVQTSFNFKVTNVNVKPLVKRTIPDFEAHIEEAIYYPIQGDIFDDPDGVVARVQILGVRPWMTVTAKEISAFPQEHGTFTITYRGYDDDSAYAETSFKIKVINRPPIIRQLLPEKVIAQNKAFRFKVPQTYFSDPDGQIVKLKAVKLPSWLTFDGSELRGTPTELGTYRVGIQAFDNAGDSVETPFVITVDLRGNLNTPPVLRFKIPDTQLFVTQQFSYKVPDSLFYDTNGYVDRIETPDLPAWLTFKNNELSGLAGQAGTYTVTLRAVDDDETSTVTSFKIEVRYASLNFELIQAGKAGLRRLIGPLREGDVLSEATLPERITIYAVCEAPVKKIHLKLNGPYQKSVTAERFPFSLFDEEAGFVPIAGSYTLTASAFNDSVQVSTASVRFKVQTSQPLADWEVYPNPFSEVCNVKLPDAADADKIDFKITSLTGSGITLNRERIQVADHAAYLDLTPLALPSGLYFLQIYQNGRFEKVIKIVKQ
ncbi:MAG: putative Ig domain-containing protein [Spirosomataceae bacterium]